MLITLITENVAATIHQIRTRGLILTSIVAVTLIAIAILGATGRARSNIKVQRQAPRERVETELITLRPGGFSPVEITRVQGRFLLAVDNRSGLDAVALRLDRVTGNRLREINVPRRKLDWREFVDLPPGRYLLTEAEHPDWNCAITITPR